MAPRFSTSRGSGRYRWVPRARGALFQEPGRSGVLPELDVWDFLWRTGVNEGCPEMYSSPPAQKISHRWIRSAGFPRQPTVVGRASPEQRRAVWSTFWSLTQPRRTRETRAFGLGLAA